MGRRLSYRSSLFATAALALASWGMAGCPSNFCLVKVCRAGTSDCSCSWSTCPSGSTFDTNRDTCVCERGRTSLGGSCLNAAEANAYCGKGNHFEPRGCVRNLCPAGQEISQDSGMCLPKAQVDQVAQNMGVPIGQNQKLGCPPGLVLVVEGAGAAACVPPQTTCTRDEVWNGQACVKSAQCPPGSIFDPGKSACIAYSKSEEKEFTVDLQQWAWSSYGPEAGAGTASFCTAFSKKPLAFGVTAGGSARVKVTVALQAPSRQIAQTQVVTSGIIEASGAAVLPKGAAEIQRAAQDTLGTLVVQGGKSTQDTAATHVSCIILNPSAPISVPSTGGI